VVWAIKSTSNFQFQKETPLKALVGVSFDKLIKLFSKCIKLLLHEYFAI